MSRIKTLGFIFTVVAVVAFVFPAVVRSAQVVRINAKKGHIYIDEGKDSGYTFGAEVCFYASDGQEITCGKVRQTLPGRAMVQIKSRVAKKIKKGIEVKLKGVKIGNKKTMQEQERKY